jgi:two-component system, OmpR family, sensor histidine kinase KdpD
MERWQRSIRHAQPRKHRGRGHVMCLRPVHWTRYVASLLAVVLASAGAGLARYLLGDVNISLIYLVIVVGVATIWGRGPALLASVLAAITLYLFFLSSFGARAIADTDDWLTLLLFLAIAVLTGRLASTAQERAAEARRRARAAAVLYDLSTALLGEGDLAVLLPQIAQRVAQTFDLDACHILLAQDDGRLTVVAGYGSWDEAGNAGAQVLLQQVLRDGRPIALRETAIPHPGDGAGATHPTAGTALYLPLVAMQHRVGVLRAARAGAGLSTAEEEQLLATFAQQAALAIEKAHLAQRARQATALEEANRVKTALLAAVSHDLRSPLAAIKTAVTGLLTFGPTMDQAERSDLLRTINQEADRLTRLVADLLDLSRMQSGALHPQKEWVDIAELITAVVERLAPRITRPITVTLPDDLLLVRADYVRIDQVLSNLIENAAAYAPPGSPIAVSAQREGEGLTMRVRDEGPGIPRAERERVFEPFYRGATAERAVPGSGLGLAICRGIVEAHGGTIRVEPTERGTSIAVFLPDAAGQGLAVARQAEEVDA